MLKRILMVAVAATAISIPAVAGGATKHKKVKKHVAVSHNATETISITNLSPSGAIVPSGRQTYTGSLDGTLGGVAIHGAVRGVNNYSGLTFQGTITSFGPDGSIVATVSGTGKLNADGSLGFTGTSQVNGGTGTYKGATGSLTFQGTSPNKDADGDNDGVAATFTATGTIKY